MRYVNSAHVAIFPEAEVDRGDACLWVRALAQEISEPNGVAKLS